METKPPKKNQNSTEQKVIALIAKQLGKPANTIKQTDRIVEDIGADSLDVVEMLTNIEDTYGVQIPDDDAAALKTIGDVAKYLDRQQA